jgi:hypothetical protein
MHSDAKARLVHRAVSALLLAAVSVPLGAAVGQAGKERECDVSPWKFCDDVERGRAGNCGTAFGVATS